MPGVESFNAGHFFASNDAVGEILYAEAIVTVRLGEVIADRHHHDMLLHELIG